MTNRKFELLTILLCALFVACLYQSDWLTDNAIIMKPFFISLSTGGFLGFIIAMFHSIKEQNKK